MTAQSPPAGGVADPATAADGGSTGTGPARFSRRVGAGALWSGANTLLMRLANIAVTAVVARVLAPEDFGVFAVALTAHAVIASIGELGVSSCLARGDLDPDEIAPTITTISLVTGAVLALGMFTFAEPLATALGSSAGAGPMRVLSLAVLLVGVFAVPSSMLVREFRQRREFVASAVGFVPANALLLGLAALGGGAYALAWSRVVGQLVAGLVIVAGVDRLYRPGLSRERMRLVLGLGLPLAGANLVNYVLLNVDYMVVGNQRGAHQLGLYLLAFNISSWSTSVLGSMVNGVAMPAFSRVKAHRPERLPEAVVGATQLIALISTPIAALSIGLSGPLVHTLYGGQWTASAPIVSVLALYGSVNVVVLLYSNVMVGLANTRLLLIVQLLWLAALVPAMVLGVVRLGVVGAAVAHVAVITCVVLPVYARALRRATGVRIMHVARAVLPPVLAAAAAGALAHSVATLTSPSWLRLVTGAVAGGTLYLLLAASILRRRAADHPLPDRLLRVLDVLGAPARVTARVLGPARGRS